jgi:hypothetical protein
MNRVALREWWLDCNQPILCRMKDDAVAILIIGPRDQDIAENRWRFGFQVFGEENIRWRMPEDLDRVGSNLEERRCST